MVTHDPNLGATGPRPGHGPPPQKKSADNQNYGNSTAVERRTDEAKRWVFDTGAPALGAIKDPDQCASTA